MTMKMLVEKDKQTSRLRARSRVFIDCDVPTIEKQLTPFLKEGETMPDVALLMKLAVRRVAWLVENLAEAVRLDANAGADLSLARDERWDAWGRVTAVLSHIRHLLQGLSGSRPPVTPRLTAPIPRPAGKLLRHAERVLAILRHPSVRLPEWSCVTVDPKQLATNLGPATGALRVAVEKVVAIESAVCLKKEAKRKAKAGFEAEYGRTHRLLVALTSLAGKRIRPMETGFKR